MPISEKTAYEIACAWREVRRGRELLSKVDEELKRGRGDIRDAFGRPVRGLQLGVPSSDSAHRMFDVPWEMAAPIIRAHIAHKMAEIEALSLAARAEIDAPAERE